MRHAIALILAIATLAGCIGDDVQPMEDATAVITDPTDYSYVNQTDGSGWHVHDYWKGQDSLIVVDAEKEPGGFVAYGSEGAPIATFRPEPGDVIPQGTGTVHVTATWGADEAQSSYDGAILRVKTANDADFRDVGPLVEGEPLTFNTTNEENDPPHQTLSLWQFEIRAQPKDGASSTSLSGAYATLVVTVDRGLEIPPWPPHPDFWGGSNEIQVASTESGPGADVGTVVTFSCTDMCTWRMFSPDNGTLIPYDASRVEVTLSFDPPQPNDIEVWYHGADTWDMTEVERSADSMQETTYTIDVDQAKGDSPYALQSLWEFETTPPNFEGMYTHRQVGTLSIQVTAYRE